jgi:hypothetical protein
MTNTFTGARQFIIKSIFAIMFIAAPGHTLSATEIEDSEDLGIGFDIPHNGEYGSDEDPYATNDPVLYAAELREKIRCLDPNCEAAILEKLKFMMEEELQDFYKGLLLSEKDDPFYFSDVENKLKGFKVLEGFLRQHNFLKAANYVNSRLNAPLKNLCVGTLYRAEQDDYVGCDLEVVGNHCEKHCLKDGVVGAVNSIADGDNKLSLLGVLNGENPDVQNAAIGACKVKNIAYKVVPTKNSSVQDNSNLCGILNANSVISVLAGKGSKFIGGEQSAATEYSCYFVSLSIDKSGPVWKANPDYPEDNYVIQRDGITRYRLKPEDFRALQEAVNTLVPQKRKNQNAVLRQQKHYQQTAGQR